MGNDGGDIPRRKQLVKEKSKVQVANAESIAMGRSKFCNLTKQKLKQPLAICRLGCLYNYQNIIQALMQKNLPQKYSYIKKLKDIKKIEIQRTSSESKNYFACPITKLQYNGFNKFVAIWNCGHVISRKAFKQVKVQQQSQQKNRCLVCQKQYSQKDVIDLNLELQQLQKKRNELINKRKKKLQKDQQENEQKLGEPTKKVKKQLYLNSIQRLDGQFRDVIRQRQKFKQLFYKPEPKN